MKKKKGKKTHLGKSFFIVTTLSLALIGIALYESSTNNSSFNLPVPATDQSTLNSENHTAKNVNNTSPTFSETSKEGFKQPYKSPPPTVTAKAFGVINLTDNVQMYVKNPNLALPPASVTKIMTAIVALERYNLDRPIVIPPKCTALEGSKVGLQPNDVLSLEDILYGLLVQSGADAACAIANINDPTEFIEKMNQKANDLGMGSTVFENEVGFDAENRHFSSINDIIKLSKEALKYSSFRKIIGTKKVTLKSLSSTTKYELKNTNNLLFTIPGTVGIKTGYTEDAKGCLSYLHENKGQEILIVILGSEDRFKDTLTLLNWAQEQIELLKQTETNLGG